MNLSKYIPAWPLAVVPKVATIFGMALNKLCIYSNGGTMPVVVRNCDLGAVDYHACVEKMSVVHLKWLSDIFPWNDGSVSSIGDAFIFAGSDAMLPALFIWLGVLCTLHYSTHKGS
jgi:hypothetical protein